MGHYLAFFLLFGLGYRKPALYHPLSGLVHRSETVWAAVSSRLATPLTAASWILVVSATVVFGRVFVRWRTSAQKRSKSLTR